jgi:hypothetical protein
MPIAEKIVPSIFTNAPTNLESLCGKNVFSLVFIQQLPIAKVLGKKKLAG